MTPEVVWAGLRRDWCELGKWKDREIGKDLDAWFELVTTRRTQLEAYALEQGRHNRQDSAALIVIVADAEPMDFLAGFWAGVLAGWTVALANPNWAKQEWQSVTDQINPDTIWSSPCSTCSPIRPLIHSPTRPLQTAPFILIPTGGTAGQLKFACHTWATLTAAVHGFRRHFQSDNAPINSYCVLPLYHVSGLMQVMRTWLTGGQMVIAPFKDVSSQNPLSSQLASACLPPYTYLSLVPTQLARLVAAERFSWLRQFHTVLLGGAPTWTALLNQAIKHQIPICLTYGMTETGAMVTAMRSQDFLQSVVSDRPSSGWPMPHATIQIEDSSRQLSTGEVGRVVVTSSAIAHGYHNLPSSSFKGQTFYTDDLGYLDSDGQLHITGRASSQIISGGENIFSSEVESALRSTGQLLDVCVVGLPDAVWGEVVSAAYVPLHPNVSIASLKLALDKNGQISRYKYPKRWLALESIPRNAQGKINHQLLKMLFDSSASQSIDGQ